MTQQLYQNTPRIIGFRSIQLLKTQTLGIGSYGSVCKALCDDLLCAAKIVHPTLIDPNAHERIERQREHRLPIRRFMQECEFMSAIRHPNIVQYLGTHQDPQTRLPVLLMELMDNSLTHFLENSQDAVPYHIQINFCHDITLAISYLHSNGIIHRDLSSNNVLLCGNVKAKVTDFGMAKLGDINPPATRVSFTMCPGTDVYMPPEAVKDKPVYTAKIDCFAIGTLIIQILTRCFPDPEERLKIIQTTDPQFPGGTVEVRISEIERRQNHISQVDPNHPLLPIALDCLKDSDVDRLSAQELCHRVAALKETPQFTESVRRAQQRPQPGDTTEREEELQQQVQDTEDDIIQQKDEENHQMRQEHSQQIQGLQQITGSQNNSLQEKDDIIQEKNDIIRQKDRLIEEKERHLQHVSQELESNQQVMAQFQTRIQELEQQLKRKSPTEVLAKPQPCLSDPPQTHHSDTTSTRAATATRDSFTLKWREGKKAPRKMDRGDNAIVNGDMVYLRIADTRTIYAYKSTNETWNELPECDTNYFSLAVVNNHLTTIGGEDSDGKVTNKLFRLTEEDKSKTWTVFQTMHTGRSSPIVVCTSKFLIVAGGKDQERKRLKTVEVMDTETLEWYSTMELPEPLSRASATICHDQIYIVGGVPTNGKATKSVYTCTLTDLFQSRQTRSLGKCLPQSLALPSPTVWNKVADLPVVRSTCVALHGRLLAIGGCDSKDTPTSDVHIYHPISNTWEVISTMKISRSLYFAAVLPTNQLMVVGGRTSSSFDSATDSVEITTVTVV